MKMGRESRSLKVELTRTEARWLLSVIGYALASSDLTYGKASSFCKVYSRLNDELWSLEGTVVTQREAAAVDQASENE